MLQRRSLGFARSVELDIDSFENCCQISCDLRIPKPDDVVTFVFELALAVEVACGHGVFIVVAAVELDDETLGGAEEVDDVWTDRRLTAEV